MQDSAKLLESRGFKVTTDGWPDKLIDDGQTFYYVEEKLNPYDLLKKNQIKKTNQLLRDGRQVLIMVCVYKGKCKDDPIFARVLQADPNGKFYDIGPWGEELPPKTEPIERKGIGMNYPLRNRINIYRHMETHIDTKERICRATGATTEQLEIEFHWFRSPWWTKLVGVVVDMGDGKFALANIVDDWWTTPRNSFEYPDYWSLGMTGFLEKYPQMKPVYQKAKAMSEN